MTGLIGTSFFIYELFGSFGPFSVMSIVSGGTLALALYARLQRSRHDNWLEHHYMWITWSYVGLVMATGSHLVGLGPPSWPFRARALLYWGLPCGVGAALIFGWRRAMLTRPSSEGAGESAT